ncbi:MAG: hypothetical protein JXB49_00050 [Bacteroidales bacterium]|nr:hypothetical protein [Bacteroidales bacterium]
MKSLEAWLHKTSKCPQLDKCRKDDLSIDRHLETWLNKENLGFSPANLGPYAGFVGPSYSRSNPKILYVARNPAGFSSTKWEHQKERLSKYRNEEAATSIFKWETRLIWETMRNSKWRALFEGPGLRNWEDIAFSNICMCPTMNDKVPSLLVISRCIDNNLLPLVNILKPNHVIFLSMSNQEGLFEAARKVLDKKGVPNTTAPHPARRGTGQTAANLRKVLYEIFY